MTTDPEERLRALVQPVMRNCQRYAMDTALNRDSDREPQWQAVEHAAILACARAQAEALREGERCIEGGYHEWRNDNGMGGEMERLRVCIKCKNSRKRKLEWWEPLLAAIDALEVR